MSLGNRELRIVGDGGDGGGREVESKVVEKVGEVIREIERAKQAEQVIFALHSLAVLLFPIDFSLLSAHSSSFSSLTIQFLYKFPNFSIFCYFNKRKGRSFNFY